LRLLQDPYRAGEAGRTDPDPLWRLLLNPRLRRAYLGAFALMFAMGILVYALPLKVDALGFGPATTGMLLSAFGLTAILLFISPANRLSDRLGRIKPGALGLLCISAALLALGMVGTRPAMLAAMVVFGTGFAMVFPAMAALVVDETRSEERGRAFGLFYAFFSLGVIAGSLVVGALDATPEGGFLSGALGSMVLAMILLVTGKRVPHRKGDGKGESEPPLQRIRLSRGG